MPSYPNIPLAQTVVRLCEYYDIERIVICAGSRNAPLTNGFVSQDFFKTYSIVDERAACFFALGMAQQLRKPVAVVCTSGSALLNFYPAIAEAYYSDIPLIVLSADRMPHRIDIGDGQTIRQTGVFEPHLEAAAYLKPDVSHASATLFENPMQRLVPKNADAKQLENIQERHQHENEKEISRVIKKAIEEQGPVHLNIPMEEPLYEMTDQLLKLNIPAYKKKQQEPLPYDFNELKQMWHSCTKKWIIIGQQSPGVLTKEIISLICKDPSVVVFTETTSNLNHHNTIASIDTLMAPLEQLKEGYREQIRPDLLLTLGGMVVSKKIKFFLRKYQPQAHWHIDTKKGYNTYYCLKRFFKNDPQFFLHALYSDSKIEKSSFQSEVIDLYQVLKNNGKAYLDQLPFSDLYVFQFLAQYLPNKRQIQLANSSSIRYAQLFQWPEDTHFFCNRGTSGIDGSTATAVGAAQITERPTFLITGDLSFFYDVNGLWNDSIPKNFKIILINNQGGGIFRILPGNKDTPSYDRFFETVHQREAKSIAKAFNLGYQKVTKSWSLKRKFLKFIHSNDKPQLLEIKTPRKINDTVLLGYFKWMANLKD